MSIRSIPIARVALDCLAGVDEGAGGVVVDKGCEMMVLVDELFDTVGVSK